ncbi:DsbA family protein [Aeromicrobium duanguangcaii]|uniref:DsbA family protein n=1 Tax=Aeromicrobium duanguangcaii TaxID=2968086 RepID=A0ABY5KK01_9ACTN|nr:thioredoxin domain-containing protein [Aeromicrobium duanguangcaii]MCD9153592.1 DsbA family protein [Aeromicrobium duanguangcaii]UUI69325.1 DsbA family protein [Aeromicrobium duanguangcaii]
MTNQRRKQSARAEAARLERERAERRKRLILTGSIAAAATALVAAAAWGVSALASGEDREFVAPRHVSVGTPGFAFPAKADPAAPVVEVYADFLCPHCADFADSDGERLLKERAEAGEISLRFVPMTIMDGRASDGPAHDVMNAAVCAADVQGPEGFWAMHTALFAAGLHEDGSAPSSTELTAIAQDAGAQGIDACIDEGRFVPWLSEPRDAARDRGVTGTPTVLVDGEKVDEPTAAKLQAAIDAA